MPEIGTFNKSASIKNKVFTNPKGLLHKDACQVFGESLEEIYFYDCIFECAVDEVLSIYKTNAEIEFHNCTFTNVGRGVLIGRGPEDHKYNPKVLFNKCTFDICRRAPMAHCGTIKMVDCVIKNWRQFKGEKAFGVRACGTSTIECVRCAFENKFRFEPWCWLRGTGWFKALWEDGGSIKHTDCKFKYPPRI